MERGSDIGVLPFTALPLGLESAGVVAYLFGLFLYAIAAAVVLPIPVELLLLLYPDLNPAFKAIALGLGKAVGAMPRFDARANVSKKPHFRSLAVMMPSTLSRRVTTIHRVFLSSITRAAALKVVSGLTVATGEVMTSRTKTFDGFFPFEVTCHRMSRSVMRPIGRPC